MDTLTSLYPWMKAVHIISVIAWMAGLLYLPRLFVYHTRALAGSELSETFKIMERRLLRAIILPAAAVAVLFGLMLAGVPGMLTPPSGWFHSKVALVVLLLVYTHLLGRWRRAFAEDRNTKSATFFRAVNEIPTVLMVAIVLLVVVKPF